MTLCGGVRVARTVQIGRILSVPTRLGPGSTITSCGPSSDGLSKIMHVKVFGPLENFRIIRSDRTRARTGFKSIGPVLGGPRNLILGRACRTPLTLCTNLITVYGSSVMWLLLFSPFFLKVCSYTL